MSIERIPITDEQAWLDKRKHYITASEVAALYGCHRFMTIADLYALKKGALPDKPQSKVLKRGKAMEQVCADAVGEKHPNWKIYKANQFLADDERKMGATPDFYIQEINRHSVERSPTGVLETKIVARSAFEREWSDDLPPLDVILQTTQQMLLAEADFGAVGVLVIGEYEFECHVYDIPRHKPTEDKLIKTVAEFWQAFKAGKMPEFDYAKDKAAIKALFAEPIVGKSVDMSHDNRLFDLLAKREQWKDQASALETLIETSENEIKAKIGDAEIVRCGPWEATYKIQHVKAETKLRAAYSKRVLRAKQKP